MVKSTVSILCALVIIISGAIFENSFVQKQFEEFRQEIDVLYEKTENKNATESDVVLLKQDWLDKKKYLHIFIPHNEIKEIDLWIFEAVTLVRDEEWTDALSKMEVLKNLAKEIPKTFSLRIENIL